jgi:hypothetical protein
LAGTGANLFADATKGANYLLEVKDSVVAGFNEACFQGPMADEQVMMMMVMMMMMRWRMMRMMMMVLRGFGDRVCRACPDACCRNVLLVLKVTSCDGSRFLP